MDDLCCNRKAQANKYPDCLAGPHGILSNNFPLKLLARKIPIKANIIKISYCGKLLSVKNKNKNNPPKYRAIFASLFFIKERIEHQHYPGLKEKHLINT